LLKIQNQSQKLISQGLKVVAELVSVQEKVSPQPAGVVELPIKTFVDLPVEPTMELAPSLTLMRALFL